MSDWRKSDWRKSDGPEFRIVGDRLITEKQHQSEKSQQENLELAIQFKYITIPVALIAAIATFLTIDTNGWFWKLLAALFAGAVVFQWLIPVICAAVLVGVVYLLNLIGAFG